MSDSFLTKLKNKVAYQIHSVVDDPEAKEYAEKKKQEKEKEKEKQEKEKEKEKQEKEKKQEREKQEPSQETQKEPFQEGTPPSDSVVVRIFEMMIWYTKEAIRAAFYPVLTLLMASLISNEMIVYPSPIRLGFFLFTLFVCMMIKPVIFLLGFYFLCKKGYDYYINELMWQEGMPKEIIMTTLFAFLPLTTNESEGRIKNFFMKPFQYGGQFSQKDGEELAKRMEMYEEDLREAFPYLEKIKNKEPFAPRLEKITTQLKTLHDFVVLPDSDDESEEESEEAGTNGSPPLPPTIAPTMAAPVS
jgi:flagellar biosynthesis GTPase FlhF